MNINTAIDKILSRYGELADIDRLQLKKAFNDGLQQGLTVKLIYNAIRLICGTNFKQQELFSAKETAELLKLSERDLFNRLHEQIVKPERTKGEVYYFPKL